MLWGRAGKKRFWKNTRLEMPLGRGKNIECRRQLLGGMLCREAGYCVFEYQLISDPPPRQGFWALGILTAVSLTVILSWKNRDSRQHGGSFGKCVNEKIYVIFRRRWRCVTVVRGGHKFICVAFYKAHYAAPQVPCVPLSPPAGQLSHFVVHLWSLPSLVELQSG